MEEFILYPKLLEDSESISWCAVHIGVTVFSIEPYQIGFKNEEGIESGAFWFYRKLGFRPIRPELARMVLGEEHKIATRVGYRTPARILRQLAGGHVLYEAPSGNHPGDWDNFHVRHLGLAVQRRMAQHFNGDEQKIRRASAEQVARALGVRIADWNESERRAFSDFALMLALIPNLSRWSKEEKRAIACIIRAKAAAEESRYVRLLQTHSKLRDEVIQIGSRDVD